MTTRSRPRGLHLRRLRCFSLHTNTRRNVLRTQLVLTVPVPLLVGVHSVLYFTLEGVRGSCQAWHFLTGGEGQWRTQDFCLGGAPSLSLLPSPFSEGLSTCGIRM